MGGTSVNGALTLFQMDEVLQPRLIPMELNFEGWPLFTREKSSKEGVLEIRHSISTEDGRRLNQVWRVAASADNTLPGPFDEDVFVGVMALVRQRGGMPPDGRIRFSIYELSKVMRKSKRGGWTKKIRESLDRIGSTTYYMENCFYVVETESLESYRFPLWTVHFSGAKSGHGRAAEHHTLKFDDVIIRSYNAGYLKLLDTDLYFRLSRSRSPLAKALYRLADQRRRDAASWSVDVFELRDLLAMSQSYKAASRIWEVLQPAVRALKHERFLQSAVLDGKTARLKVHPDFACDWLPETRDDEPPPSMRDQAITALIADPWKVWPNRARALVDRWGPEKAFHALDVLSVRTDLHTKAKLGAYVAEVVDHADAGELEELAHFVAASREEGAAGGLGALAPRDAGEAQPDLLSGGHPPTGPGGENGADGTDGDGGSPLPEPFDPHPAAQETWEAALQDIEARQVIDASSMRVWFDGIVAVGLGPSSLTIAVPNSFAQEYVGTRFKALLEDALAPRLGVTPEALELTIVVGSVRMPAI